MIMVAGCLKTATTRDLYVNGQPATGTTLYTTLDANGNPLTNVSSVSFSDGTSLGTAGDLIHTGEFSVLEGEMALKVSSNDLANTSSGSEGIRRVGALGGYKLSEFFEDTALRGPSRDYTIFSYTPYPISNLNVTNAGGDVYSPTEGYFHLSPGTTTLIDNSVNYAYWNNILPNNIIKWTTTRPNVNSNIVLGVFVTAFGKIMEVDPPEASGDFPLNTRAGASQIAPSLIVNGLEYSAIGTALSNVVMTGGVEYHDKVFWLY